MHIISVPNSFLCKCSLLRQKGFTLLEVMVAMSISVVIYIGAYSLLNQTLVTNETVSQQREALESLQRAVHFMQQDFEQITPRPIRAGFDKSRVIDSQGASGRIEFTRLGWRNPIKRSRSNMQRVSYSINDEVLLREHWNVLDRDSSSESKKNEILEGVKQLKYRFLDPQRNTWEESWDKDEGDPLLLPSAIEVTLVTDRYGDVIRVFRIVDNEKGELRDIE